MCFFSTAANEESNPIEGIQEFQSAVKEEAAATTAQRRRELEHYLKLKRFLTVMFNIHVHNYHHM